MYRMITLVVVCMGFVGCAPEGTDSSEESRAESESATTMRSQAADQEMSGVEAYETVCARCHETGLDGAPATGDTAAWSGRSTQWEAVLFEHAKNGYLDMPAKGGNPELSDRTVVAAADYMLSLTYPNRSPD